VVFLGQSFSFTYTALSWILFIPKLHQLCGDMDMNMHIRSDIRAIPFTILPPPPPPPPINWWGVFIFPDPLRMRFSSWCYPFPRSENILFNWRALEILCFVILSSEKSISHYPCTIWHNFPTSPQKFTLGIVPLLKWTFWIITPQQILSMGDSENVICFGQGEGTVDCLKWIGVNSQTALRRARGWGGERRWGWRKV